MQIIDFGKISEKSWKNFGILSEKKLFAYLTDILQEVFMRQFYIYKNHSGYYNAIFVDPETGKKSIDKSTHTKDKFQATIIATQWFEHGVPDARPNSRKFYSVKGESALNLKDIAERISQEDAVILISMLTSKYNLSIPHIEASQMNETISDEVIIASPQKSPAERISELSTASKKRVIVVHKKTQENIVSKPQNTEIPLSAFLLNFWDYEKSEFIQRHIAHGHSMTKRHTDMMKGLVKNYWMPYFGDDVTVQQLDKTTLDDFFFYLHTEKGLKGGTVNKAINCGSRAMRWLFENHKISENPMAGIERFNVAELERGIPTESEVKQLLETQWTNDAYYLAFKLGIFCGLRAGEISGLRVCDLDLDADIIHVRHSWNDTDGLKCPKNSDVRDLPIDHQTLLQVYNLAKQNPNFSDLSYVFFSAQKPEQPYWPSYYCDGLYEALESIGISEEQRKERNIVFHSLRHFCATILSQRTDLKTVQAVMGHRSEEMSKHYSNHDTEEKMQNMRNIMQVTWNDILTA